jgi:hypothetical protein
MTKPQNLRNLVLIFWLIMIAILSITHLRTGLDYVGGDSDDVLRLVQIRDFLSGQGWFDLMQYRLGLDGGTLMHWSRLVDAPIAIMISIFSGFTTQETAETAALFVWPLLMTLPVIYGFASASRSIGGTKNSAIIGAIGAVVFIFWTGKFKPGAIDHHNVQLAIFALSVAILLDRTYPWISYGFAGFLSALALAIGAETTPLIAAICAIVAVTWAWYGGKTLRRPTRIFSLSMGLSLTVIFFGTTPPHLYNQVVCDALSMGFYALGITGSAGLFFASALLSYKSRFIRFCSLAVIGVVVGVVALVVAPQCLQSPLADLDPFLVKMWLNNIVEARSILALLEGQPYSVFNYYMVPLLAIILCLYKISNKIQTEQHLKLLLLLCLATGISLLQVRATLFANLVAMIAMAVLVADFRTQANADPKNVKKSLVFIFSALVSLPIIWTLVWIGLSAVFTEQKKSASNTGSKKDIQLACKTPEAFQVLAAEPKGVVSSPSNFGATVLRYTHHHAISAPYHRNQLGLLAEIKSSVATPSEAEVILKNAKVTHLVFCKIDPQVSISTREAKDGLYALLARGEVPDYLELIEDTAENALQVYRLK